jgi:hypothetical protein
MNQKKFQPGNAVMYIHRHTHLYTFILNKIYRIKEAKDESNSHFQVVRE